MNNNAVGLGLEKLETNANKKENCLRQPHIQARQRMSKVTKLSKIRDYTEEELTNARGKKTELQ